MSVDPIRLAVIVGSNREGRFGGVVADWFVAHARRRPDLEVDVVDLAEVDLPIVYPRGRSAAVAAFAARLDRADAFVVVTPEYNHGYPAGLKQAIDLAHEEWRQKPVGFVSYGGMAGGLRAVEQLRQVFAELHATTVRETVSFHNVWPLFDDHGQPHDPAGSAAAATVMLDELAWWSTALRTARRAASASSNREVLRRFYEEAVSKGDLDVIDDVVHPDLVHHSRFEWQAPGAQGLKDAIVTLRTAFPDLSMAAEDVIAEGDRVVARFAITGTHEGHLPGAEPTGEPFHVEEIMIVRLAGGRIVELWAQSETIPLAVTASALEEHR